MDALLPGLSGANDLHPLFVHFPVALWLAAALFFGVGLARSSAEARRTGRWLLYAGTAAAVATVATGFLAANRMGHGTPGHDLVHVHRNIMLAATVLAALGCALARAAAVRQSDGLRVGVLVTLVLVAVLTTLGADRGANLVFGYGMGVTDAPAPAPSSDHNDTGGHQSHPH